MEYVYLLKSDKDCTLHSQCYPVAATLDEKVAKQWINKAGENLSCAYEQREIEKSIIFEQAYSKAAATLEELIPDVCSISSEADNADNLQEAVLCYIQYGEYSIEKLKAEIESALDKEVEHENPN